ncbi:hypothetical protein BpHYR1_002536 [Brachionus plicatilis]|uniref:Uncharacterized protein n=1 Tax=Brachionus plicatilis TaxID=10195 RepID=A0A3M7SQ87_BRAPC|nr:hypothetical protein BpHYR1_002536 [Brachionus plicatilis]
MDPYISPPLRLCHLSPPIFLVQNFTSFHARPKSNVSINQKRKKLLNHANAKYKINLIKKYFDSF